ncbi:NTP transferase domain-containing protein [Patescibacteria group bacterium]|nr:NTP transferase domain-containing protein [Patescibacteria group bacterium]
MKGVILAGGTGTRMLPATKVVNKHLLNVWDRPMIYYPIQTLVKAGIKEILIVTGGNSPGDFLKLLGNGKEFGLKEIHYTYQEGSGGIAEALGLAEDFADDGPVAVILGDNIFENNIRSAVEDFEKQIMGAKFFLKKVTDPERFGVAEIKGKNIIKIIEKPKNPKSNYAVTGLYMYDHQVFDVVKTLKPSKRDELEITDVNNFYIKQQTATFETVKGFWSDAGTFESLLRSSNLVAKKLVS